ncbi:MAG: hypothetical protein ABEJ43_03415 [Haloferacaceae archaeon]
MPAESRDTGPVTVSTGAVTAEKSFTDDEFPVPTVAFDIRSTASEPVEIRLTDDIPESVEMGAIGFHPDYDGDNWTAFRDRRVRYETKIEPGGSVRTVYGVRVDEDVRPGEFLGEPRLELHDEAAIDIDDAPVHGSNGSVDETLVLNATETDADVSGAEPDAAAEPGTELDPASLAAALAEAVREDAVADEDLETLRDAVGSAESAPTSVQVRIDRLQSQVEDLAAYTDALETFLDEEGEGQAAVAGFRDDLDEVSAEVEALTGAVESLDERVVDVESTVDRTATDVETLTDDVDALDEEVTAVSTDLAETREVATSLREEVDERLAKLSDRVDEVGGETEALADEVERLSEFRERLNSAFGPGPGGDEQPDG